MWKRLLIALPLAAVGAFWFLFLILPWGFVLRWHDPHRTSLMRQRINEADAAGRDYEIHQDWVPLPRISRRLQRAVIVAEDARFRNHHGVDWHAIAQEVHYHGNDDFSLTDPSDLKALAAAIGYYHAHRDRIRGRSTLTQQLAKNLYFSTERSLLRKVEELIVAKRLEWFLSKDRILELYLNLAEWGPGVFGAQAAARTYFDRPAADLTSEQAAALAATLPHPLSSNPNHRAGRMQWRIDLILRRMGARGPVETVPLENEPEAPQIELQGTPLPDTTPVVPGDTGGTEPVLGEPVPTPDSVGPRDTTGRDTISRDTTPVRAPPDTTRPDTGRVVQSGSTARSIACSTQYAASSARARTRSAGRGSTTSDGDTANAMSPSNSVWTGVIRRAIAVDAARASTRSAP